MENILLILPVNALKSHVVIDPVEVVARLNELDPTLDQNLLLEANMRGYEARLETTPAHAPTAAGTLHWHEFVASLRTVLVQRGWNIKNHKNCPLIVSPDKSIMLLVMTGDNDTGKEFGLPSNQADKGAVLDEAVQHNRNYELFENAAVTALKRGESGTQLWVLLYHVERDYKGDTKEIRTELSLPSSFEKKKIIGWNERIILPAIEIGKDPEVEHVTPSGPIDIPVERRRAG